MSEREELCELLKESAILRAGPGQPIGGRDHAASPWMFYSWGVTMTGRGSRLAAQCVLERLATFESTQIATVGYTAMPILSACLLLGDGRYTGMCVREKRKEHGSYRRVDGPADCTRPVVLIDDSLSSGTSMLTGIEALEAEGFQVEGCVALVNFPWRGGLEKLQALGYRVEVLFDIWQDLGMEAMRYRPAHERLTPPSWGPRAVPDGLHPAVAARRAAELYLADRQVPQPPRTLDQDYDARGGTFVSFRWRSSDIRLAREGLWHFDAAAADPCRDLVLAAVRTVQTARGGITPASLEHLKIAATFFGPLEKVPPRQLDFPRYGIVVRSRAYETRMGGALPNTQVFISDTEQYRHARVTNARIGRFEPHDIYRHTLTKCVEPGAYWLPFGFPKGEAEWTQDGLLGERLVRRTREWLEALEVGGEAGGEALADDLVPAPVSCVAVTIYHNGLVGCSLAFQGSLDECIERAARGALSDPRYGARRQGLGVRDMDVSVSLLHDREWHGEVSLQKAAFKLRRGLDSIAVLQGTRRAVFLPVVMSWYNWTKDETAQRLLQKAGIRGGPCSWATFPTVTWLGRQGQTRRLEFGYPVREPGAAPSWREDVRLLASYVIHHLDADGLPEYQYLPVTGQVQRRGTAARRLHALWALLEASAALGDDDLREAALKGLRFCAQHLTDGGMALPGHGVSPLADGLLLAALSDSHAEDLQDERWRSLGRRVRSWLQPDGRVTTLAHSRGLESDHDFMPGTLLLALARFTRAGGDGSWLDGVGRQLDWYRRRFRIMQPWGMVGWQPRAWNAIHELTGEAGQADFVLEMADFALEWQHERDGSFITDLYHEGPSFHTAFITEGVADAWALSRRVGDAARAGRLEASCRAALRFMDRLVIRDEDTFCMADPPRALGGVRAALARSDVRIDYVSHTLIALARACGNGDA